MQKKQISMCGLDCGQCGAYIAWKNNDKKERIKTAKKWNRRYQNTGVKRQPLTPSDINCRGCLSLADPVFRHCRECGVRLCGLKKNITNCGKCTKYDDCVKITSLHRQIPDAKKTSDRIKQNTK